MDDSKYQIDLLTALNERLMSNEKMYRHVAECTGNLFMHFDYKLTPPRVDLIGPWDEVIGGKIVNHPYDESYMLNFIYEEDQDTFRSQLLEAERHGLKEATMEIRSRNKNHWFLADAYITYDSNDNPLEKIIQFTDITSHKITSEELEYLAYYDSLTGVYNRNYFMKMLRDACKKAEEEKTSVEVLFIDIDDFKKINDTIGLLYGDELVQEFGQFLKEFNSNDVTVGRFGSDVFVVYIYNPCGSRSADVIYRSICERLRHSFVLSNKSEIHITITAGVAEYPDAGKTSFEVMKNAEIVLYEAKDRGNNIQYFEPDILSSFNKNVTLENDLNTAINNEEFILYYQPQYYSENGRLRGVEVLLRWPDNREGGFKSMPQEFIKIAEKNRSIIPIGEWVLKEGIRSINEWRAKYHIPFILCINISKVQLKNENFVEQLQHIIQMYDINPEYLELEISEIALSRDLEEIADKIKTLRGIGVKVAIDNFGVGTASLNSLKDIVVDTLKIDSSYIVSALTSDCSNAITETVISLAKKLQIETIAEGVETKEQFNYLRKNKCDVIQGYLLGRPVPKSEFEKVLIRQTP